MDYQLWSTVALFLAVLAGGMALLVTHWEPAGIAAMRIEYRLEAWRNRRKITREIRRELAKDCKGDGL